MEKFRTTFSFASLNDQISYDSAVLMTGSCFSEHIAARLSAYKFSMLSIPSGIIYNPVSLGAELSRIMNNHPVHEDELFLHQGIYRHFDFHNRFAHPKKATTMQMMNAAISNAHEFLNAASHLIITFGTSVVYRLADTGAIVANNHKLPASRFEKVQLNVEDIVQTWQPLLETLAQRNKKLNILFTVSPVRHLRDGVVENQLSKSVLIQAVHKLKQLFPAIFYFPSYEIMMDGLRDYRFYEKDMIHPNQIAVDYIFELFKSACIHPDNFAVMDEVAAITVAMQHKPFFPGSDEHRLFKRKMLEKAESLQKRMPHLDLKGEADYFRN